MPSAPDELIAATPALAWRTNLALFVATAASMFATYFDLDQEGLVHERLVRAGQFAGTLMAILLAHEFGHYFAARLHRVEASLPYFLPMPLISPLGTMGAVIRMRGTIGTRRALLDIGASGPLAGLTIALPAYAWGTMHSRVIPAVDLTGGITLGESLLLRLLDRTFGPEVAPGMELALSPMAYAAWGGMFVTMLNLIPLSQLDGGHIAYALFGPKQNQRALTVHRAMLAFALVSLVGFTVRDLRSGLGFAFLGRNIQNSASWLIWFELLPVLGMVAGGGKRETTLSIGTRLIATIGLILLAAYANATASAWVAFAWLVSLGLLLAMEWRGGVLQPHTLLDHPPTGDVRLDPVRKGVAIVSLLFFVALFMPSPFHF